MGLVKSEWIESQERGWSAPDDQFVCADCVEDEYLKKVISNNLEVTTCDYCEKESATENIAAPVGEILEPIANTLFYYYNDPTNACVPRDSGDWAFDIDIDTNEALLSLGLECHDELFEVISNAFFNDWWVPTADGHWASSHTSDILAYMWEMFVNEVKYKSRFFFSTISPDPYDPDGYSPSNTLTSIGVTVKELGLTTKVPAKTPLYRVRERSAGATWPLDAENLGAPPKGSAQAGRMNPSGISYLYLGKEKQTALAEVLSKPPSIAGVGSYMTKQELRVLDLTDLPTYPSVFDEEKRHISELLQFLNKFVREISKPVAKDGREHVEYVPSQIVCEYFAKVFRTEEDEPIDGIAYPSAIRPGGINIVIFPPESQDGFNALVDLNSAEELTFHNWQDFHDAIK